jgi:hypothetical protein
VFYVKWEMNSRSMKKREMVSEQLD